MTREATIRPRAMLLAISRTRWPRDAERCAIYGFARMTATPVGDTLLATAERNGCMAVRTFTGSDVERSGSPQNVVDMAGMSLV